MALSPSKHSSDGAGSGEAPDDALWHAFVAASDDQFCQAWLALLCRQLPGVVAGAVLLQADEANTFVPVAVWPAVPRDLSFLGAVAQRALDEGRGVVQPASEAAAATLHVAYPVEVGQRTVGAVVLEAAARAEPQVHALLRQLHWGIAWLHGIVYRRELASREGSSARIGSVMEVVATALRRGRLQQTLFDLANHLARQLQCARVAIGLVDGGAVRVAALSNAAWFDHNTALMKLYRAAMEDAFDQLAPLAYKRPAEADPVSVAQQESAHARLARDSGAQAILSLPLQLGAECVGVLTLERNSGTGFDAADHAWLETMASLLPAVIEQRRRAERGSLVRWRDDVQALLTRLFGPRYLLWKFSASALLLTTLLLTLVDLEYRVAAKTVIEGQVQRAAVAPFDSFVMASRVRAGDTVKQGQVLCLLDDRDLRLEQHKWNSEREQYTRKLREAMANHELAAIQVLSAQVQQADAQLALVTDRLRRVEVVAPFDGVVISGDLSQLIGSPVEQGKKLFEIAPLHEYRVILQVDERDIGHLKVGQPGKLLISGIVGAPITLHVSKITPVASAHDGRNFFRAEAALEQAPPHLRPGMEGIGKVSTGKRRLWWILLHSFTDWLRLSLWTWLP